MFLIKTVKSNWQQIYWSSVVTLLTLPVFCTTSLILLLFSFSFSKAVSVLALVFSPSSLRFLFFSRCSPQTQQIHPASYTWRSEKQEQSLNQLLCGCTWFSGALNKHFWSDAGCIRRGNFSFLFWYKSEPISADLLSAWMQIILWKEAANREVERSMSQPLSSKGLDF